MRIAYFDCFSGISGEMLLGALLDAGLPADHLRAELAKLPLNGYSLDVERVARQGVAGTHVSVLDRSRGNGSGGAQQHPGQYRNGNGSTDHGQWVQDPPQVVARSLLSEGVKQQVLAAIKLLTDAEAHLHGPTPGQTHLQPSVSAGVLVEIVGALAGLALLGVERVECSPVNVGGGFVETAYGLLPVPSPVTAEILRAASVPIYGAEMHRELVTPTGAAILAVAASAFGPMPSLAPDKLGYGAGNVDVPGSPNLLRVTIGAVQAPGASLPAAQAHATSQARSQSSGPQERVLGPGEELVALIEANLDDMNPQYYDFVMQRLLGMGALDAFLVPIQTRANRPGVVLSVLCKPENVDELVGMIFEETTTLSVRMSEMPRRTLLRDTVQVQTRYGSINAKVARTTDGKILHVRPEYEDVKQVALELNVPIDHVYEEARHSWNPNGWDGHQQTGRTR